MDEGRRMQREGQSASWDGKSRESEISNNSSAGKRERAEKEVLHAAKRIMLNQSSKECDGARAGKVENACSTFPHAG